MKVSVGFIVGFFVKNFLVEKDKQELIDFVDFILNSTTDSTC